MRAAFMYGAGDVRVETVPDPKLEQPTDALVRIVRACVCGSDLHPYHQMPHTGQPSPMGHEFVGVVEDIGSDVSTLSSGDFVIAPFAWSDNTCDFCREGFQTSCRHGGFWARNGIGGGQAEAIRVPLADGTLVKAGVGEDSAGRQCSEEPLSARFGPLSTLQCAVVGRSCTSLTRSSDVTDSAYRISP